MSSRRGGFGSSRRVVLNNSSGSRPSGGSTLNERFAQLKKTNPINTSLPTRRVNTSARTTQNRFSSVMTRRTGQAAPTRVLAGLGGGRTPRGGRGRGRGGARPTVGGRPVRNTTGGRGARGGRGRGRGGRGATRGGRDNKRPASKDDLDKELEAYMGGSKKHLDEELDEIMQTERNL